MLNNNVSFKSRNNFIKDADLICRKVRTEFPYISHSIAAKSAPPKVTQQFKIVEFIKKRENILKEYREDRNFIRTPFKFYKEILHSTIKEKVAACYELSSLVELILRMNGINNCVKASLVSRSGKKLNHCVTCLKTGETHPNKRFIIIDPWLQESDYLGEMIKKYKNQYASLFRKIHPKDPIRLELKPTKPLNVEEIEYFQAQYPNLVMKNIFQTKGPL